MADFQGLTDPLSEREIEILTCLIDGLSNREIAYRLHLSYNTIKWHNSQLYSKLDASNRDEAIAAKTKIYTYFPELKAYLWHQSPYYKLKAGNFKDRKEAEEYQLKLRDYFPKGVFIMNDIVELKPEKSLEENL